MNEPKSTVRLNVSLDAELHRALRLHSIREGVPLIRLVPELVRKALAEREQPRG
jgi:hypothetical protein